MEKKTYIRASLISKKKMKVSLTISELAWSRTALQFHSMMKSLKEAASARNVPAVAVEHILTPLHCPP